MGDGARSGFFKEEAAKTKFNRCLRSFYHKSVRSKENTPSASASMREYSLVLECREEMWHCVGIRCRSDFGRRTTTRGLLHISSVRGNEQIADSRSERNMTLAYWRFSRLAHSPSNVRLQVLTEKYDNTRKTKVYVRRY